MEPVVVAGWSTSAEQSRTLLYSGPGRLAPMSRDFERLEALGGRLSAKVVVRTGEDLFGANAAILGGQEYRVVGVAREPNGLTWTLYLNTL